MKRLVGGSLPFFLYCGGLGALMLSDVLVSRFAAAEDVVLWAKTRSLIAILGIFATMGLDQLLIRQPEATRPIVKLALIQFVPLSLFAAFVSHLISGDGNPVVLTVLLFGSGLSYLAFQYFRILDRKLLSQLSQQGWKLLLLLLVCAGVMGAPLRPYAAIAVSLSALSLFNIATLLGSKAINWGERFGLGQIAEFYRSSLPLMSLSVMLAVATMGEQLFVTNLAPAEEAASYFSHAVFFQYPVSLLNGYIAFWIGPWLLRHRADVSTIVSRSWRKWLIIALSASAALHLMGWIAWDLVFDQRSDLSLRLLFFAVSLLRTVDVLASSYNGVLGPERAQRQLIGLYLLAFAAACLFGVILSASPLSYQISIPVIVAVSGCMHWLLRAGSGIGVMIRDWKRA